MKKLFYIFLLLCSITILSCKSSSESSISSVYGGYAPAASHLLGRDTLNALQMDSMISVDKLPAYDKWQKNYMKDAETNQTYTYAVLFSRTTYVIYTVKLINDKYVVIKKSIKK